MVDFLIQAENSIILENYHVTVVVECFDSIDAVTITPQIIDNQQHMIGDPDLTILLAFPVSAKDCNSDDISYSITVSPSVSFISIQGSNIVCTSDAYEGTYQVTVKAKITRSKNIASASSSFELQVKSSAPKLLGCLN